MKRKNKTTGYSKKLLVVIHSLMKKVSMEKILMRMKMIMTMMKMME